MTQYLFNSIQVTSYYSQVTSRHTSYKFELGHLLEEWRIIYLTRFKLQVEVQVTSRGTSYKSDLCF
jgi:hypothetical protein